MNNKRHCIKCGRNRSITDCWPEGTETRWNSVYREYVSDEPCSYCKLAPLKVGDSITRRHINEIPIDTVIGYYHSRWKLIATNPSQNIGTWENHNGEVENFTVDAFHMNWKVISVLPQEKSPINQNKQPIKNEIKENTMNTTASTAFKSTKDMIIEAGVEGVKAGAAAKLAESMVDGVQRTFHENLYVQMALTNPVGRWAARLVLPIAFYFLACSMPKMVMVDAEKVKSVCWYAHQGNMTLIVGPIIERLVPLLKELATKTTDIEPKS